MRRTLSSGQTFYMKFLLPAVWLAGFVAVTVALFTGGGVTSHNGGPPPPEMKWLFLGATILGGFFLYWWCMRLKRVELDEDSLYISNYLREVRVPLRDLEEVTENRWINIRPVTLEFRREMEFGSSITFMPKTRWWGFWRAHPVVAELEAAAASGRRCPAASAMTRRWIVNIDSLRLAERVRAALVQSALDAYEDAALRGLCCEGAWEAAVSALRQQNLDLVLTEQIAEPGS